MARSSRQNRDTVAPTPSRRRGRPRAEERLPEESRTQLLDAAAKVFAARGYGRATIDEIAATAGLSKGTFYWHFPSKAQLFQSLLEERIDRPVDAVLEITRTAPAERPTAPEVGAGVTQLLARQPEIVLLLQEYWSAAARDPEMRERYAARQQRLREGVAEALRVRQQTLGGVPFALPPEQLATAFIALAVGLGMEAQVADDAVPASLYGEILALVYDGNAARFGRLPTA